MSSAELQMPMESWWGHIPHPIKTQEMWSAEARRWPMEKQPHPLQDFLTLVGISRLACLPPPTQASRKPEPNSSPTREGGT